MTLVIYYISITTFNLYASHIFISTKLSFTHQWCPLNFCPKATNNSRFGRNGVGAVSLAVNPP